MNYSDVFLVGDKLLLATEREIDTASAALHTRFPPGYREYMLALGSGNLNRSVRVLPPNEIAARTAEFQESLHFLYDDDGFDLIEKGLDLLSPDRLLSSVYLVDAGSGSQFIYHPDNPDAIFLLPHGHMSIDFIGVNLEDALDSFILGGAHTNRTEMLDRSGNFVELSRMYFEPDRDTRTVSYSLPKHTSYISFRSYLIDLALGNSDTTMLIRSIHGSDQDRAEYIQYLDRLYGGIVSSSDKFVEAGQLVVHMIFGSDLDQDKEQDFIELCRRYASSSN